jgi:predicted MFS family arabinose efflux permease
LGGRTYDTGGLQDTPNNPDPARENNGLLPSDLIGERSYHQRHEKVVLTGPAIMFLVKGRLPVNQVTISRRLDLKFLKNPLFLFMAFSNLLQGLGYFIPGIYLPSYASDLSMSPIQSTLVLSVLNLASVVGQILAGYLADRWGSMPPLFLSTFVGAWSVVLLWGFSKSFGPLMNFSVVYGLSAGGYSVLWSRVAMEAAFDDPNAQLTIYGILAFER